MSLTHIIPSKIQKIEVPQIMEFVKSKYLFENSRLGMQRSGRNFLMSRKNSLSSIFLTLKKLDIIPKSFLFSTSLVFRISPRLNLYSTDVTVWKEHLISFADENHPNKNHYDFIAIKTLPVSISLLSLGKTTRMDDDKYLDP